LFFRHKCLSWTVEWISAAGEKTIRNALETYPIFEAYDRAFPLPRQDRPSTDSKKEKDVAQENISTEQNHAPTEKPDSIAPTTATTEPTGSEPSNPETDEQPTAPAEQAESKLLLAPHRNLYFYLHRPRTTTKKPVVVPVPPLAKLQSVLREHTVLEFPTIYALPDSPETILASKETSSFILEEEYLRTASPEELGDKSAEEQEGTGDGDEVSGVDLQNVDEEKVMEVLKQELFESV
jgi:hypothetical protein